jgi:short-subunit dehydrogenase
VLVARRKERLDALAAELAREHGIHALACPLDLLAPDATAQLTAFLSARNLIVGMLVVNAGIGVAGLFHASDPARLQSMIDLHCRMPVLLLSSLLPAMVARGNGAVIMVASVAGYQLGPGSAVYAASKGFDLLLGESLWAELRPLGVDALAVSPGYTRTEFHAAAGVSRPSIPDWAWTEADDVAREALRALGRSPSVVPGIQYKLLCAMVRLVPRGILNRLALPIFFRKLGRLPAENGGRSGT